jgi:hypothetical protein
MNLDDEFDSPDEIPRDRTAVRNGRYPLPHADGRPKSRGWRRASKFAGSIEDMVALSEWHQRGILIGAHERPDIIDALIAEDLAGLEPKVRYKVLMGYVGRLTEVAKCSMGAANGTLRHSMVEARHEGRPFNMRPRLKARLDNYELALAEAQLRPLPHMNERVILVEEFEVAGRLDTVMWDGIWNVHRIADLKTAKNFYGWLSIVVQLWLYSQSPVVWDKAKDCWVDMPIAIDPSTALVNWMPEQHPDRDNDVDIYEIDIFHGRRLAELIRQILIERDAAKAEQTRNRVPWGRVRPVADQALTLTERYAARLRSAGSEAEVKAVGTAARQAGCAMDALIPIGRERISELALAS